MIFSVSCFCLLVFDETVCWKITREHPQKARSDGCPLLISNLDGAFCDFSYHCFNLKTKCTMHTKPYQFWRNYHCTLNPSLPTVKTFGSYCLFVVNKEKTPFLYNSTDTFLKSSFALDSSR